MKAENNNIYSSIEILSGYTARPPEAIFNVYSHEIPEMKTFEKLSKFSTKDFHYRWSLILLLINFFNIITATYFFGTDSHPTGLWLDFELITEAISVCDFFFRLFLIKSLTHVQLWLLQENPNPIAWCIILTSSMPYASIFILSGAIDHPALIALRFLKLLRAPQIIKFFQDLFLISPSSSLKLSIIKSSLVIALMTHISAMLRLRVQAASNDLTEVENYADSLFWGCETLTGIVLLPTADSAPQELAIFIMISGVVLYGFVFVKFSEQLLKFKGSRLEKSNYLKIIENWCDTREINDELRQRIYSYYLVSDLNLLESINIDMPQEMPVSLKSELALHVYKELISKVKLFELGEPSFMMSMVRAFKSLIFLPGDYIIRYGDFAHSMYFISKGSVEVLATDNTSQIALMNEGHYFGEIGVLFDCCRTVYVKSLTPTILAFITKEKLLKILYSFPEHLEFLQQVAQQRMKTCTKDDIDVDFDLVEDNNSSSDSDHSGELETPQYYVASEHAYKPKLLQFITVPNSKARKGRILIEPLSPFFYIWSALLIVSYTFCVFIIPYSIAFGTIKSTLAIDGLVYSIFVIDLIVHYKSSILTEFRTYIHEKETISQAFMTRYFILDILSVVPCDWVYCGFECESSSVYYVKLLRLLKLYRILQLYSTIRVYSGIHPSLLRLLTFIYAFFTISHVTACGSKIFTNSSTDYIEDLYWAFSAFSQTSYADSGSGSTGSKFVMVIILTLSKVFATFLCADYFILILAQNRQFIDFVGRTKIVEEWMRHCKLPFGLKENVRNFYKLQWEKLLGNTDESVLDSLPESLSTDLRLSMYSGLSNSGLFPVEERGAILGIIRKCRVALYNKGTYIVNKGEIGLEMYFILDGIVEIVDEVVLKVLNQGAMFGEFAILNENPGVRAASALAKTDLTLAVLSLEDFKIVADYYQGFEDKVRKLASERLVGKDNSQGEIPAVPDSSVIFVGEFNDTEIFRSGNTKNEEVLLEKTNLTTLNDTKIIEDLSTIIKYSPLLIRIYKNTDKEWVYLIVLLWNVGFIPYQVAFDIKFSQALIMAEVLTIVIYLSVGFYYWQLRKFSEQQKSLRLPHSNALLLLSIYHIILSIPVSLICNLLMMPPSLATIIFSYVRVTNIHFIFIFFIDLKRRKIFSYILIHTCELFLVFWCTSHIIACIYIMNSHGIAEHSHDSSIFTIYIDALYWSVGSLAHTNLGDLPNDSSNKKLFTCFVQATSLFLYAALFGSIISLISVLDKTLRNRLYTDFVYVKDYLQKKKIDHKYSQLLDDYFNLLWESNKGILETIAIEGLPQSLKAEIFLNRYSSILTESQIFQSESGLNIGLIRSFYRMMTLQFSLVGDIILRINDFTNDMFYIITGEVTIISLQGDTVLATIGPGSHFGEANMLINSPIRTATALATKICYLGVISNSNLELLFSCFPEFKESITETAKARLQVTFNTNDLSKITESCNDLSLKLSQTPTLFKRYTKRLDMLISHKLADVLSIVPISKYELLNIAHIGLTIYSCFAIPLQIVYITSFSIWLVTMELICIIESLVYLSITLQQKRSHLKSYKQLIEFYIKERIIFDFAAVSPFNFIFSVASVTEPTVLIYCLRCIRLLAILRIHSILSKIMILYKKLFFGLIVFEGVLILVVFLHWATSILDLNSDCMGNSNYLSSLYLTVSVVTGTGHTDAKVCGTLTKVQICIVAIISTATIATLNGLLANIHALRRPLITEMFYKEFTRFNGIKAEGAPKDLKFKLEAYCKFSASLNYYYGETFNKNIYTHLPKSIVHNLIYHYSRHMLKRLPFLKGNNSETLLKQISLNLLPQIYLPQDYLIYKNDIGNEMFFISIGSVNIIAPDNSKVIKTLSKGDFFGEMALINNSRRMCSVVSNTFCLVFALKKKSFKEIMIHFPEVLSDIRQQSEIRSRETTSITKGSNSLIDEDQEQQKVFNHLSMYSLMSSAFSNNLKDSRKVSMLTGMKNIKADTAIDTFEKDRSQLRFYQRRPSPGKTQERRKSQESLGKDLVANRFRRLKDKWMTQK